MNGPAVSKLISRSEFRHILKSVVHCLQGELNAPGLAPLTAEEIHFWFQNITVEDIETVKTELEAEAPQSAGHSESSKVHAVLQKIREKMRGSDTDPQAPKPESKREQAPE